MRTNKKRTFFNELASGFMFRLRLAVVLGLLMITVGLGIYLYIDFSIASKMITNDVYTDGTFTTKQDFLKAGEGAQLGEYETYETKDYTNFDKPTIASDVSENVAEINKLYYNEFSAIISTLNYSNVKTDFWRSVVDGYSPLTVFSHMAKESGGFADYSYAWNSALPYAVIDDNEREEIHNNLVENGIDIINSSMIASYKENMLASEDLDSYTAKYMRDGPLQFDNTITNAENGVVKRTRAFELSALDTCSPRDYTEKYIIAKAGYEVDTADIILKHSTEDSKFGRCILALMHSSPAAVQPSCDYSKQKLSYVPWKSHEGVIQFIDDILSSKNYIHILNFANQRAEEIKKGSKVGISPVKSESLEILSKMTLQDPSVYLRSIDEVMELEGVKDSSDLFKPHDKTNADSPSTRWCYFVETLSSYETLSRLYFS